jgi:hypothetical protein
MADQSSAVRDETATKSDASSEEENPWDFVKFLTLWLGVGMTVVLFLVEIAVGLTGGHTSSATELIFVPPGVGVFAAAVVGLPLSIYVGIRQLGTTYVTRYSVTAREREAHPAPALIAQARSWAQGRARRRCFMMVPRLVVGIPLAVFAVAEATDERSKWAFLGGTAVRIGSILFALSVVGLVVRFVALASLEARGNPILLHGEVTEVRESDVGGLKRLFARFLEFLLPEITIDVSEAVRLTDAGPVDAPDWLGVKALDTLARAPVARFPKGERQYLLCSSRGRCFDRLGFIGLGRRSRNLPASLNNPAEAEQFAERRESGHRKRE